MKKFDSVKIYGRVTGSDICGSCIEADKFYKSHPRKYKKVEHIHEDTPEAQKKFKQKKVKVLPYIEACTTDSKTGKKKCTTAQGWDEKKWKAIK